MRGAAVLCTVALVGCVPVAAPTPSEKPECRASSVIDGDTIVLSCTARPDQVVRLSGIDAPEVSSALCPAEAALGKRARAALQDLLAQGPVTGVTYGALRPDGRREARVEVAGRDLAAAMLETGQARTFRDGTYTDWCRPI